MYSYELRTKFLDFFKNKGHIILPSSSLIPKDDPSVLLTTAGMQQFKRWFSGADLPKYNRVTTCQKCIRTSDIEEVGDDIHFTFFEMLGNFSFGDYFKKEAISWGLEFLVKELKIDRKKISAAIFKGDKQISRDNESYEILKSLGFSDREIKEGDRADNFWGPTGDEGPCGPTVEFYVGDVEVWNLVFNQFYQEKNKKLKPLKQKGVDTGMGLERVLAIVNDEKSVYETDLFEPLLTKAEEKSKTKKEKSMRIICDHIKAAAFLIADGVISSNVEQGYILRRLIRRAMRHNHLLGIKIEENLSARLAEKVIEIYKDVYSELRENENKIKEEIASEEKQFEKTLSRGLKKFRELEAKNRASGMIKGEEAFHLYDTYGFPLELTKELSKEKKLKVDEKGFFKEFRKHREKSRAGLEKKFKGGLQEQNYEATKLHTATHLLHQALRNVLGSHVRQMGSNITSERLRFDFSHPKKLTPHEIKKVEDLVNKKIAENLEVEFKKMPYAQAVREGALAFFKERYPEMVRVYRIGDFSKEICGGPHVKKTSELGRFKITKEEAAAAGIRRIKALMI